MRSRPLVLAGLALALCGYNFTGSSWTWQDHPIEDPFYLDVRSFPSDAGTNGAIEDAILVAMEDWNGLDLDLTLLYGGRATDLVQDNDGFFHIYYDPDTVGSEGVLAFTGTWVWSDGAAYDCDMVFMHENAYGPVLWSSEPDGYVDGRYDIQAVTLHELGHCLGLGHSQYTDAVMTAYYYGYRVLTPDDVYGVGELFGTPCEDGDGDGVSACDGDCDDANAAIFPGAAELCDGRDDNCDGVVDEDLTEELELGHRGVANDGGWFSAGNAFSVEQDTALVSVTQRMAVDEGTRLVWSVYGADAPGGPWTLVRSEISNASAENWQTSPPLHVALEAGRVYSVALGAHSAEIRAWYDDEPDLGSRGVLTPLGGVSGRDLGDQNTEPDGERLWQQRLVVVAPADADGDGQTATCGDCDPASNTIFVGADELCGGLDEDCDGRVDEGVDGDQDGDGAADCVDSCPADPSNDADGDGLCADVDPCPDDATNDADGDGLCGREDPCPQDPADRCAADSGEDPKGRCGCAQAPPASLWALLIGLLALRRR